MQIKKEATAKRLVFHLALVFGSLLAVTIAVVACSSTSGNTASGMGTMSVMLSDPATCQAPDGPYSHVYVTISDVEASVSSTASATDNGWVDLTPGLSKSPKQVDLLGLANNQCFLASLGDSLQLQAGSYQQIRVILDGNSAPIPGNLCGNANNCVMLTADTTNTPHTLQLSSEAQTGIKIPPGQIAGGAITVATGKTEDLDIDFNTCESIVQEGNGQYTLMPVLRAGVVSATSTSINGTVVDAATGNPVVGMVSLSVEQKDSTGIDRVIQSVNANADGTFVFCPLAAGTYDVVVVGTNTSGSSPVFYEPAIVTGVSVGATTGTIKLFLPSGASMASLGGQVTSQNSLTPPAGTVADVNVSALTTVGSATYTIPLPPTSTQSAATLAVETVASASCPSATDCMNYTLNVPSGGVSVGAWSSSGVTLSANAALASYSVDGTAIIPGSGGTADCSPSEVTTTATALTGAGPYSLTGINLAFKSCH